MTSKSFSSKGLLGDSLRRNLWGFVLGGVGFFMTLLLPTLMIMQRALETRAQLMKEFPDMVDGNWEITLNTVATMIGGDNMLVKAVFIVLAVVCGVAMFAYLHARQKVDFYHSLPVSRTRLFANNFVTGIVLSLSTYVVVLAITIACVYAMGFGAAVDWNAIGGAAVSHVIVFLLVYALTVLTTVVCGNTVITLLLLLWVHLSPMLVQLLFQGLCARFYESYISSMINAMDAVRWSPVLQYFTIDGLHYKTTNFLVSEQEPKSVVGLLVIYLLVALAVTALGAYLFRIRKSERSGTALAFAPAKLPIKVYICLTMGVAFGQVFGLISGDFWFWVGLVIGTVLFHWIVEIIYAFDFRAIFAKPLHLGAILVVLFAGVLCMQFDVTGYDKWLPNRDKIQGVSIEGNTETKMTDSANIDAVYRLAEIGTQVNRDAARHSINYLSMTLSFRLGGRTVSRYYLVPEDEEVQGLLDQIYASEEYKRTAWTLFEIDLEPRVESSLYMDIYTNASAYGIAANVMDEQQVRQILTTLREEALARQQNALPVLHLAVSRKINSYERYQGDIYVTAEDKNTLALIKELTGVSPVPLTTDNVKVINLQYSYEDEDGAYRSETVQVTDTADIKALLQNAINSGAMNLGGLRNAAREGFALDPRIEEMEITACINLNGVEDWAQLHYADGQWPEAIVEKYRPDGAAVGNDVVAAQTATGTVTMGVVG